MPKSEVNNAIYNELGHRWYTAFDDPVALLRAEANLKNPWIAERIEKHFGRQAEVLDIGCGGGFLSNYLSAKGHSVTGVDISEESLVVAKHYDHSCKAKYLEANAYHLPFADASFDVVTAMDFLEHVEDLGRVIDEVSRVLKPGGCFFFHTFNRNWLSYLVIIKLVEWLVKNTPKDMHVLHLFLKPSEVEKFCEKTGMRFQELRGIKPVFSTIPIKHVFTGVVPEKMRFEFTRSLLLSYIGYAVKN